MVSMMGFLIYSIVALGLAEGDKGCITMDDLSKNMPQWVDVVPYSHLTNRKYGKPTDCSGFVSWALQMEDDVKAYQYSSSDFSARISTDDLRYGDIITHVFDKTKANRCDQSSGDLFEDEGDLGALEGSVGHVSGHVFFFDRWDDDDHKHFWAYESTETQDQTEACLAQNNPLTRSQCFNHHVLKKRKQVDKWSSDNCTDSTYGYVSGGARRLNPSILCPST